MSVETPEGSKRSSRSSGSSGSKSQTKSEESKPPSASASALPSDPVDALNTEFIYYSALLRTYAPILTREYDKMTTHLWMKKLFGPEYHSTVLKPKRNKYLLYLAITIYNDEAYGIFRQEPPTGKLPEIADVPFDKDIPLAAWEAEKQWDDTLKDIPDEMRISTCYLHDSECPTPANNAGAVLDAEFQFYLWLSKPYVALLPDPEEKTLAACWIQLLCGIAAGDGECAQLKEIRNDYMRSLLGYVHDLRVDGPFRLMPPVGPVPPLALLYEDCATEADFADPTGKVAEEFLAAQPHPISGAFAYINVTGELFGSS